MTSTTEKPAVHTLTHWLSNAPAEGHSGRTSPVYNPATGQVQAHVPLASKAEIDAAVQVATAAAKKWRSTSLGMRSEVMFKFRELLSPAARRPRQHRHPRARQSPQ